jgi:hypothetical protein
VDITPVEVNAALVRWLNRPGRPLGHPATDELMSSEGCHWTSYPSTATSEISLAHG